ncbi:hypothetical protein MLD38_028058 [Melastoma candidum]|uniref:Uncharacterized protein n=1 Tax=Melastoma candidum TaxID=119954 RepID=A0ACB9N178_9MYRT|nr:hypothetical protein MLD38_028058 [Melastoma candidum]
MARAGSPCGACKFLRRKCVRGCVFAPYFCHEQGAAYFAAIHKVFGASNVSKLLANLPVGERCEAAVTISYEAQARLHDPIYGCVSHIFALQQQVFNLQSQLACLKEHASQSLEGQNLLKQDNASNPYLPQFNHHEINNNMAAFSGYENAASMNSSSAGDYRTCSMTLGENGSFGSFNEAAGSISTFDDLQADNSHRWGFHESSEDLQSVAFGHLVHH